MALDSFVHMPFLYLPTFYCMREMAMSTQPSPTASEVITGGLRCYQNNFISDVSVQAAIFVPVQALNFGWNPPHLRVPTVVTAGVVWISVLSLFRGSGG